MERGSSGKEWEWGAKATFLTSVRSTHNVCTSYTFYTLWRMDSVERTDKRSKSLNIRVEEKEMELWREAAWVRKVTLSEWARRVLSANAEKTIGESK